MRIHVDAERCQGHTLCSAQAPDLIGLSEDDGHAHALVAAVPAGLEDQARRARVACPEQAITLDDQH